MSKSPDSASTGQGMEGINIPTGPVRMEAFLDTMKGVYNDALQRAEAYPDNSLAASYRCSLFLLNRFQGCFNPIELMEYRLSVNECRLLVSALGKNNEMRLYMLSASIIHVKHPIQAVVDQVSLVADLITEALKHD